MKEIARHTLLVRVTHWVNAVSFLALLVSGGAILLAHPRLYWGEAGGFGGDALLDLPLPLDMDQSGWGRSLHFLAAWICVANGLLYTVSGMSRQHFGKGFLSVYDALQRGTYRVIVFIFFPLMIATGLSMSPAVTSAVPIVGIFGGYQSARTIHFFVTDLLVVFVAVHIAMVYRSGFRKRLREITIG